MAHATALFDSSWTAADLVERFGAIPLSRVRSDPPPGSATERDVIEIHDREDRLYELVDGVLLEKDMGAYEAYLACLLAQLLGAFVREHNLGITLGADGMTKLAPELVRIPDFSFFSWQRLPDRAVPRQAMVHVAPDLAVEVISKGNTREEMQRKLGDYFVAGVRQVWYVYPARREVMVYRSVEEFAVVSAPAILNGGDILPGFRLDLAEYFAEPGNQTQSPPPAANG